MFENLVQFFKNLVKKEKEKNKETSGTAKERLHLVLMQDRANVSADFLELMKQEIIEVIKKYIDIDEKAIDVHLTNNTSEKGTNNGAPALYANIPIINIRKSKEVSPEKDVQSKQIDDKKEKEEITEKKSSEKDSKLKENDETKGNKEGEVIENENNEIKESENNDELGKSDIKDEETKEEEEKEETTSDAENENKR